MPKEYFRSLIACPSQLEAETILEALLKDKLIAGGLISAGQSRHWWQGKIDREDYYNTSAFTIAKHRDKIIKIVEQISADDTPGIVFFKIDYSYPKFLDWIDENTK